MASGGLAVEKSGLLYSLRLPDLRIDAMCCGGAKAKDHGAVASHRTAVQLIATPGDGTGQCLAFNANIGNACDAINMDSLQISADGYHYAVVATIKGQQCVIIDGKPGEFYALILPESLALGERGEYVQYVATETSGQSRKVIIDLAEGGIYRSTAFDEIRPHSAIIASNGAASAYIARIGKQWCAVLRDKPGKLFDDIGQAAFSHDGKDLYFTALMSGQWKLVSRRTPPDYYTLMMTSVRSLSVRTINP